MKLHKISRTEDLWTFGSIVEETEECQGYIVILSKQCVLHLVFRTLSVSAGGCFCPEQVPRMWYRHYWVFSVLLQTKKFSHPLRHHFILLNISAGHHYWQEHALDIRGHFFMEKVVKHGNVVESQPLEAFRKRLDVAFSALVQLTKWWW